MPDSFLNKLKKKWNEGKFVCVGLDPDLSKIPETFKSISTEETIFNFNKSIIDNTSEFACAFKPQIAFFEALGIDGINALNKTSQYLKENYSDMARILDAKRADIGTTNAAYAKAYFDEMDFDAVTVNPYFGKESLQPFLDYPDKGIIVLVKTSNPGSEEFQNLETEGKPLYQLVAENIAKNWNINDNCAVVVGATYPDELKKVREIVGDMPILVPGIGAQGGDLEAVIKNGIDSNKQGLIINSSRGIIYAEDPRKAAQDLHEKIRSLI
jgi:orotidine-5'-phosphate decarboxylase